MKKIKNWLVICLAISLLASLAIMPALAQEDNGYEVGDEYDDEEGGDEGDQQDEPDQQDVDAPVIGVLTIDKIDLTFKAPKVGQTVEEVNKTFKCELKTVKYTPLWIDITNATRGTCGLKEALKDKDTFEKDKTYDLLIKICADGAQVNKKTEVELNGKDMTYQGDADADKPDWIAYFDETFVPKEPKTPQAIFTASDAECGTLTNVDNTMQYSLDSTMWIDIEGTSVTLEGISEGTIEVIYKEDPTQIQSIYVDRQDAPNGLTTQNCTNNKNNDGKILGTDTTMEYWTDGFSAYVECTGDSVTDLKPGTYYVRTEANGTQLASGDVPVVIGAHEGKLPVITAQPTQEDHPTGQDALFIVKATGADTYEWHVIDVKTGKDFVLDPKEDAIYYKGIGTDTLRVLSVNKLGTKETDCEYNGDQYYCIVGNMDGTTRTNIVKQIVEHAAQGGWKVDSGSHWQTCLCGAILNKAPHMDKDNDGKCDTCKFDMSNSHVYSIVQGANATWNVGTETALVIKADGDLEKFKELDMDGVTVPKTAYKATKGSTIIELTADYLNGLDAANHTVSVKYSDGVVSTSLKVVNEQNKDAEEKAEEEKIEKEDSTDAGNSDVVQPTDTGGMEKPATPAYVWVLGVIAILALAAAIILMIILLKGRKK